MIKINNLSKLILSVFVVTVIALQIRCKNECDQTRFSTSGYSFAQVKIASGTNSMYTTTNIKFIKIDRETSLKNFFRKYNSPLVENADTFVAIADKYKIDYRILPAISCMESTCARFLIKETYNPFGWGKGTIRFASYDEAIERVGKGLNDIYLTRGLDTPEKIAPVYNPPSPNSWTKGVRFFMDKMIAEANLNTSVGQIIL